MSAGLTDKQIAEVEEALPKVGESEGVWCCIRGGTLRALYAKYEARTASDGAGARPAGSPKESGTDEKEVSALLTDEQIEAALLDQNLSFGHVISQAVYAAVRSLGWKLVPVEPTMPMLVALNEMVVDVTGLYHGNNFEGVLAKGYAEMLAASPDASLISLSLDSPEAQS